MRYDQKHLGLEKDTQRRIERLKSLPQYPTVELSIGGLFVLHDESSEQKASLDKNDSAQAALEKMGIEE